MCGIAGFVSLNSKASLSPKIEREAILKRMAHTLFSRGPDEEGYFLDEKVALGVRRLIIIDRETGAQPMTNEVESIHVVQNGEIYNFKEISGDLALKGHNFKSKSDTEVLVHLYEEFGLDFISYLNGMFAFALWDAKKSRLILARDRLGQKPLYYALIKEPIVQKDQCYSIIFASEPKAILTHPAIQKEIDWDALNYYLSYGYVPAPFSIYRSIRKLLPGHFLVWDNGKVSISRYWALPVPEKYFHEEVVELRELLKQAVSSHLISDVPIGAFLSGGTDSALVAALMQKESSHQVKTFTVGFPNTPQDELDAARSTARYLGTEHSEISIRGPEIDILNIVFKRVDEPCADSSIIPTYMLAREVAKHIKVALSGDGGDELFAGYDWLRLSMLQAGYHKLPLLFRKLFSSILNSPPAGLYRRGDLVGQLHRFAGEGVLQKEEGYFRRINIFTPIMKKYLYTEEMQRSLSDAGNVDPIKAAFYRQPLSFGDRMLYTDTLCYLPDDGLFKLDRMSMAHGLEVRVPFLDYKLVEYAARIPFSKKFCYNKRKPLLQEVAKNLLPSKLFCRPKRGFSPPLARWLRSDFAPLIEELLLVKESFISSWCSMKFVKRIWNEFKENKADWSQQIWALLVLELWHTYWMKGDNI